MRTLPFRNVVAVAGLFVAAVPAVAAPAPAVQRADPLEKKLADRTNAVEARFVAARRTGQVSSAEARWINKKLRWVRVDSAKYVRRQGFLSAAESASYNRVLDDIMAKLG